MINRPSTSIPFSAESGSLTTYGLSVLQSIADALNGSTSGSAKKIALGNGLNVYVGAGTPNGAVTDSPPAVYFNSSGGAGTTLWVKESGSNTNTGWVGK